MPVIDSSAVHYRPDRRAERRLRATTCRSDPLVGWRDLGEVDDRWHVVVRCMAGCTAATTSASCGLATSPWRRQEVHRSLPNFARNAIGARAGPVGRTRPDEGRVFYAPCVRGRGYLPLCVGLSLGSLRGPRQPDHLLPNTTCPLLSTIAQKEVVGHDTAYRFLPGPVTSD